MYFLVDFENVHSEGLRGVEFLQKGDYLTLFYSKAANVCEQRYLKQILNSGCTFDTCNLPANDSALQYVGFTRLVYNLFCRSLNENGFI